MALLLIVGFASGVVLSRGSPLTILLDMIVFKEVVSLIVKVTPLHILYICSQEEMLHLFGNWDLKYVYFCSCATYHLIFNFYKLCEDFLSIQHFSSPLGEAGQAMEQHWSIAPTEAWWMFITGGCAVSMYVFLLFLDMGFLLTFSP